MSQPSSKTDVGWTSTIRAGGCRVRPEIAYAATWGASTRSIARLATRAAIYDLHRNEITDRII